MQRDPRLKLKEKLKLDEGEARPPLLVSSESSLNAMEKVSLQLAVALQQIILFFHILY